MLKAFWRGLPRADRAKFLAALACGVLALAGLAIIDVNHVLLFVCLCVWFALFWGGAEIAYAQRKLLFKAVSPLLSEKGAQQLEEDDFFACFFVLVSSFLPALIVFVSTAADGIWIPALLLTTLVWLPLWGLFLTGVSFLLRGFFRLSRYIETRMGGE